MVSKTILILVLAFFLAPKMKNFPIVKLVFSSILLGLVVDFILDTISYLMTV